MSRLEELIEDICQVLLDHPNQIELSQFQGEQTTVIRLKVDQEDFAKIVGPRGEIIEAIRTILKAASNQQNQRTIIELIE